MGACQRDPASTPLSGCRAGAQDCLACWADRAIAAAPTLEVTGR